MRGRFSVFAFCLLIGVLGFPHMASGTYAVITIDVCWTCDDDFYGNWEGKDYGVPLIVEMLQAVDKKATFFVSPYCPPHLKRKMLSNLRFLISRGHDLQLHTHPDVIDPSRARLNMYTREEKKAILSTGIRNLLEAGSESPIAHRAGKLSIDEETLQLLPELGIFIDSSIYPRFEDSTVCIPDSMLNRFAPIGGTYQLPIFLMKIVPGAGFRGTRALQLDSTIWDQQELALARAAEYKLPLVTVMLHFFSLYEYGHSPERFKPLKVLGPNEKNIREFDNILRLLANDGRFEVVTVRELWDLYRREPRKLDGPSFAPYTGLLPTYLNSWDSFDKKLKHKLVVLIPFIIGGTAVLAAVLLIVSRHRHRKTHKR